jgi:hydroxymethylbilane synthase
LVEKATAVLAIDEFLPAVGQGCLAVVARADDTRVLPLIAPLNNTMSAQALTAERAFLAVLDGSCRTPIAGYAVVADDRLHFQGLIAKPDGSRQLRVEREGPRDDAVLLGAQAGRELKAQAGGDFFAHS